MTDWDKINEKKRKEIMLGQAINITAGRISNDKEKVRVKKFKEDVKKWYKVLDNLHEEILGNSS